MQRLSSKLEVWLPLAVLLFLTWSTVDNIPDAPRLLGHKIVANASAGHSPTGGDIPTVAIWTLWQILTGLVVVWICPIALPNRSAVPTDQETRYSSADLSPPLF